MTATIAITEVRRVCRDWAARFARCRGAAERTAFFRDRLPALLSRSDLLAQVLQGVIDGSPAPDLRQATIFENELVLHQDPGGLFSLRLYLYGPGEVTFVHDHVSWGVSGSACGPLAVQRYRRIDDGGSAGHARLKPEAYRLLAPVETETTLPFEQGIHRTGNPGTGTTWMLSAYGPPARHAVMQCFDIETGRVEPVFPPRVRKRRLVEQALRGAAAASATEPMEVGLRVDDSAILSR